MPTTNKRINLTVPESLYEKIVAFKDENGILSDAGACLQLISNQLRSIETSKAMLEAMRQFTPEQLKQISQEGFDTLQKHGLLSSKE